MNALSQLSKSDLATKYESLKGRISRVSEKAEERVGQVMTTTVSVGLGWAQGGLRKKYGKGSAKVVLIPNTNVEADLAIGGLATVAALSGVAKSQTKNLHTVGTSLLTGWAAIKGLTDGFDL